MSNSKWAFFEPFISSIRGRGGRPASNHRPILDGVFWISRTGSPSHRCKHRLPGSAWRDLPEEFGKWSSTYRQFRRWTLAGLWELMLEVLNESNMAPDSV
ncbi:MAG: transposase [Rhizobiaceae bacterium]|nr:transposase [Rhizobiaceae bacterium]